jgi:hypothetical protein
MSEECDEMCQIESVIENTEGLCHTRKYINIRGNTLEECHKYFEIVKESQK